MRPSLDAPTNIPCNGLLLISVLTLLAIFNGMDMVLKIRTLHRLRNPIDSGKYSYIEDDIPNELPLQIHPAALTVEWPDDQLYGLTADDDWASLIPRSDGFVSLGPAGHDRHHARKFALSMYHQLHCLITIRSNYVAAAAGRLVFPGNGTGADMHVAHCLNYLREMVLCASDVTLEPSVQLPLSNGKDDGASGFGVVHKCRDWVQVREYLEQNYDEYHTDRTKSGA